MTQLKHAEVLPALAAAIPEFQEVVDEHVAFYEEPLLHVLFGDLTRFVLAAREAGERDLVNRTLNWLDLALRTGDEAVRNLVSVSFIENVRPWDPDMAAFIRTWPPALRADAKNFT